MIDKDIVMGSRVMYSKNMLRVLGYGLEAANMRGTVRRIVDLRAIVEWDDPDVPCKILLCNLRRPGHAAMDD